MNVPANRNTPNAPATSIIHRYVFTKSTIPSPCFMSSMAIRRSGMEYPDRGFFQNPSLPRERRSRLYSEVSAEFPVSPSDAARVGEFCANEYGSTPRAAKTADHRASVIQRRRERGAAAVAGGGRRHARRD